MDFDVLVEIANSCTYIYIAAQKVVLPSVYLIPMKIQFLARSMKTAVTPIRGRSGVKYLPFILDIFFNCNIHNILQFYVIESMKPELPTIYRLYDRHEAASHQITLSYGRLSII